MTNPSRSCSRFSGPSSTAPANDVIAGDQITVDKMTYATRESIAANLEKRAAEHRAKADAIGTTTSRKEQPWARSSTEWFQHHETADWLLGLAAEVRAGVL